VIGYGATGLGGHFFGIEKRLRRQVTGSASLDRRPVVNERTPNACQSASDLLNASH
jgi:hypothetical protein